MNHMNHMTHEVDFCEHNYAVTEYVAEFYGALSSLSISCFGLYGLYSSRHVSKKYHRFDICFLFLVVIGLGSFWFHATLKPYAQWSDEIPMMWCVHQILYCQLKLTTNDKSIWKVALVWTGALLSTIIYFVLVIIDEDPHAFFLVSFITVMVFLAAFGFHIIWPIGSISTEESSTLKWSLCLIIIGASFWILGEQWLCLEVTQYFFHSVWHVFMGYGAYLYILHVKAIQLTVDGVEFRLMAVPCLRLPYEFVNTCSPDFGHESRFYDNNAIKFLSGSELVHDSFMADAEAMKVLPGSKSVFYESRLWLSNDESDNEAIELDIKPFVSPPTIARKNSHLNELYSYEI